MQRQYQQEIIKIQLQEPQKMRKTASLNQPHQMYGINLTVDHLHIYASHFVG